MLNFFYCLSNVGVFDQMSQHKWAWPFLQPVDVEGLGLDDYYKVTRNIASIIFVIYEWEEKGFATCKCIFEIIVYIR